MHDSNPSSRLGFAFTIFLTLIWLSSQAVAQPAISGPNEITQQSTPPPQQIVKVIVNRKTNQITLIGNPADIAIVKRAINSINRVNRRPPAPVVSKKVVLHRQLAENVATALRNAQPFLTSRAGKITITALHTPEAIFLSGPPALVERAKEFIATLDH